MELFRNIRFVFQRRVFLCELLEHLLLLTRLSSFLYRLETQRYVLILVFAEIFTFVFSARRKGEK